MRFQATTIQVLFLLLGILFLSSCQQNKKPRPNPNIPPKYAITKDPTFKAMGNLQFLNEVNDTLANITIELADTPEKREQGLMYRHGMEFNQGMLFIFDKEERQSFWMKNTHIPLDIIFVNNDKTIVHIAENCQPYSLDAIPSFEYARYVVEVNAGFAKKQGLKVGNKMNFKRK